LRRLGKIAPPEEIAVVAGEPWGYRNRVQLRVEKGRLGLSRNALAQNVRIAQCPIASPKLNQAIETLNRMLHDAKWPRMVRSLELFTDETSVQLNLMETDRPVARRFFEWCGENIAGLVEGALDYNGQYRVSRGSFFQVNRFLVIDWWKRRWRAPRETRRSICTQGWDFLPRRWRRRFAR
jgi:hypothetical protein